MAVLAIDRFSYKYFASAGADQVVKAGPGFLHAIVIGKYVSGGVIEVSDHASDGDGNVQIYLETAASDTGFPKTIIVDADFPIGITADLTASQTNVTFIYR